MPEGNVVINSQQAAYGFFQGWLTATADFDLQLQFYNNTLAAWVTLVTSSGSSGVEWIQYAASRTFPSPSHAHHLTLFFFFFNTCSQGCGLLSLGGQRRCGGNWKLHFIIPSPGQLASWSFTCILSTQTSPSLLVVLVALVNPMNEFLGQIFKPLR